MYEKAFSLTDSNAENLNLLIDTIAENLSALESIGFHLGLLVIIMVCNLLIKLDIES